MNMNECIMPGRSFTENETQEREARRNVGYQGEGEKEEKDQKTWQVFPLSGHAMETRNVVDAKNSLHEKPWDLILWILSKQKQSLLF